MGFSCACIKGRFDIYVGNTDCRHMVIEDHSEWMSASGFTAPQPYEVEVTNMMYNVTKVVTVDPDRRNVFTSKDLYGTVDEQCIPDGFYCFKAESCGVKYTLYRAYLCNARCMIDGLISKPTGVTIDDIYGLEYYMKAIEINTRMGKLKVATDVYSQLQRILEKLGCDAKCCG